MKYLYTIILFLLTCFSYGQGATCATAEAFCSGSVVTFPAGVNNPAPPAGNNYGCLTTQPNPAWYYMEMDNGGNMTIDMSNNGSCTTSGCDIDFALWGPFSDIATATGNCGSLPAPYDCSYSTSPSETITITGASSGDVFIILITNFSNSASDISFTNTSGSATTDCSILPVELISFNGECNGKNVELHWSTLTEINNDYFSVEKSYDGIEFFSIGTVNGHGFSNSIKNYYFLDEDIGRIPIYYRLKQVDYNGNYEYSDMLAINCNTSPEVKIYPNPFNNELYIDLESNLNYSIKITDYIGKTILEKDLANSYNHKLDLSFIKTQGMYFVSLYNSQGELLEVTKILHQ